VGHNSLFPPAERWKFADGLNPEARLTDNALTAEPRDETLKGICFLLAAISIFSIQDVIVRELSGTYPVLEFVFVRSLVSLVPVSLLVWLETRGKGFWTRRPVLHLVRGTMMLLSYTFYYLAVASLPLAAAVALFFTTPLFVTAISALFGGEKVGPRRWSAVIIGFVGVVVIARPGVGVFELGAVFAVASAIVYACAQVITRRLGRTESGASIVFSQTLVYILFSGLAGLLMQDLAVDKTANAGIQFLLRGWIVPAWEDAGLMALCGLIAAAGFYGIAQAYRIGASSAVAPFEYSGIMWGTFWGFVFWSEIPDAATVAGIVIIVASGIYVLRREARLGRKIVTGRSLRGRM
jgi:S-adenosylmethionine uptake transporter